MRKVEWTLLIILGGLALYFLLMELTHFEPDARIKAARKEGAYFAVHAPKQTFYGKSFTVDGVIYKDGELHVYMTSKGIFSWPALPNTIQVITDRKEELNRSSSAGTSTLFRSRGRFTFQEVPEGLKSITVFQEAYGESFSFPISLVKGGQTNE
ncbi:hypothetical protein [Paenibacillus luteus]|uniref:hypothetical protein n=1 Tax=Paenibacillus luteus TaxID=2545753 RepID=UPI001141EB60|nr:hypothetical protein [Paenibacillus luteus]